MKITNEKTLAFTTADFTADTMGGKYTYKAGFKTNANALTLDGLNVIEGHGIGHHIPLAAFTKFVETWNEVETVGNVTTTKKVEKDNTENWTKFFVNRIERRDETIAKAKRINNRNRIAYLKEIIKAVKTGKAEKELATLLT